MTIPRKKFRELIFQILFSLNFSLIEKEDIVYCMMKILKTTRNNVTKGYLYVLKILEKKDEVDKIIKKFSKSYRIERISKVELNILRLSVFEFMYDENIPEKVTISEAVRLCRKFGTRDSAKFINGVLHSVYENNKVIKNARK